MNQGIANDQMVVALRGSLIDGREGLSHVPILLRRVLEEEAWRSRYDQATRKEVEFAKFADFVKAKPTEGLGADLALIRRLVEADADALEMFDDELKGRQGERTDLHHIIREVDAPDITSEEQKALARLRPYGTSRAQALRRLRKDRPDLHSRVLAYELSPHAAMVEAGFRPKTVTVPLTDEGIARFHERYPQHCSGCRCKEGA